MKFINNGCRWVVFSRLLPTCLALIFASSLHAQLATPEAWQSELMQDHELVGRIWSQREQSFITVSELAQELLGAKYLLLGEKHDNPDHHTIQLNILTYLLQQEKVESLTLEMMDESISQALPALRDKNGMDNAALKDFLQWDDEGWDWQFYGPLIAAAYDAKITLAAGNISRETVGAVYANEDAIDASGVLSATAEEQLLIDIDVSHCGQLPESQFPAMFRVQQARDQSMAASMLLPRGEGMSVLIAGNYHVRQDLGVPNYLAALEADLPRSRIVAVATLEVQEGETDPAAYQEVLESQPAYDYLWFTPALTSEDYCASLR